MGAGHTNMDIEAQITPDMPQPSSPLAGLSILHPVASFVALPRVASELLRRITMEFRLELPMLLQRWRLILFGIIMQYVHGIFTQLAHRMHQPQRRPLHDVGFLHTPELGPEYHWVSETIFFSLFITFLLWTFSPFVLQRKKFYTAVLWSRLLMVLVACQALRIITFSVTQLPGPSFHCRAGQPTARREWPGHWTGHIIIDAGRQMTKSCGDLVFSSHTIFMLTGILAYTEYGNWLWMKCVAWGAGAVVSFLIICSRKHYTVDIVIAWYTVPMVFYTLYRRWTTRRPTRDFLAGITTQFDEVTPDLADSYDVEQALLHHQWKGTTDAMELSKVQTDSLQQQQLLHMLAAGGGLSARGMMAHQQRVRALGSTDAVGVITAAGELQGFGAEGALLKEASATAAATNKAVAALGGVMVRPRSSMGLSMSHQAGLEVQEGGARLEDVKRLCHIS